MSTYKRSPLWYKDAIIYELNIKGFYDSNKDGIGDFAGLEQKLDYVEDLGVTAIWLLPFYPSPLRDDGYDISDYYHIREAYGNIDDFKRFLDAAHDRGLQVITELVINHTSDQHPWFQKARRSPKGSPERDMYVWSDTDKKYEDVRIIFTDTETSNWTWDPVAEQYYWHRFFHHQPDLNYDNPQVQEEIIKILDYWMNMGIDGFRLDAIPYLFEREGTNGENLPETHDYLKKLRKHVDENYDNVLFLAEANMWPEDSASYFGDGDECHMNYHFPLMPRLYMSVKMEDRHPITDIFEQTPEIPENCQWATFLRNHDELTLEMVTDEERDFMYKVYASDKTARINLGIRRRLAPLMDNDRNKIELLNVLLMSLPGTPVLYYGDEIGMGDNYYLGDRDGVRTPMQWDNNENAGFSEANPHSLYLPVIRDTEYSYRWVNVRRQQNNPNSLLNWTKRLLAKRKESSVFGRGSITFLRPDNGRVLCFLREYEGEQVLVVVNLSRHPQSVLLELSEFQGAGVREMFGGNQFAPIGRDPYQLSVGSYGYFWLKIEQSAVQINDFRKLDRANLVAAELTDLFSKANLRKLATKELPNYLRSVNWMGIRGQHLERVEILEHKLLTNERRHFGWLLLQVTYTEGQPELIQLPVAIHNFREEMDYGERPEVICLLNYEADRTGVLLDAIHDEEYRNALINGLKEFDSDRVFDFTAQESMLATGQQEISIEHEGVEYALLQSKDFNVKFYRRVDFDRITDLEIKDVLQARGFEGVPTLLGLLNFKMTGGRQISVAGYEERISTEGFLSDYVRNQYQRFAEEVLARRRDPDTVHADDEEDISLTDRMVYSEMPELVQELLGSTFVVKMADLGRTTAAYHHLLSEAKLEGFGTEALSLHYQRSLYASHKGQIRSTVELLKKRHADFDERTQMLAEQLLSRESEIHDHLKRVFRHKIESDKIRIHGDYTLEQISLLDDGFQIRNFDGDPDMAYSQRRLRRSPAKDLANMFRSLEYASQLALEEQGNLKDDAFEYLTGWLDTAYRCLATEFLTAYRKSTAGSRLLPADEEDLMVLLDTFMIEKALQEIRYNLNYRPEQASVPIRGLLGILDSE
ncbi:maltose alpha-D-glucosyltransferase [Lewinellaceae bacterium SD302]|nr:maltose alpha-D-glucosyltransferase [Lewinellaceae bacterium SD302]